MGASQSADSQKFVQNFQQQYTLVRELNDPRFGEVQIYKHKSGRDMIMVKSQWSQNESEFKQCLQRCEKRNTLDHPNLLRLLGYHTNSSNQLCGDFTKVSIYFEYYDFSLEKVVETRQAQKKYFTQEELWKLLDSFVQVQVYLERSGKYLGDIRPQNTMVAPDGNIKLAEYGIVNGDKTGFQRAYYNQEKAYIAPEFLPFISESLNNHAPPVTQKSDIFSLGLTLLECSTLISCKSLYNYSKNALQFNFQIMNQFLDQLQPMGYTLEWFRMIREMLRERPDERPSFDDIHSVLAPFKSQIDALQPFSLFENQQYPHQSVYQQQKHSVQPQNSQYVTLNPQQNVFDSTYHQTSQIQPAQSGYYQQVSYAPPPQQYQPPQQQLPPQQLPPQQLPPQHMPPQQMPPQQLPPQMMPPQQLPPQLQPQVIPGNQSMINPAPPGAQIINQSPQRMPYGQPQQSMFMPRHGSQSQVPSYYHPTEIPYQQAQLEIPYHPQEQPMYYQQPQHLPVDEVTYRQPAPMPTYDSDHDHGLSDLDLRIQRALKSSQETANRHYQTPSYY